jgi:hypothetical protein
MLTLGRAARTELEARVESPRERRDVLVGAQVHWRREAAVRRSGVDVDEGRRECEIAREVDAMLNMAGMGASSRGLDPKCGPRDVVQRQEPKASPPTFESDSLPPATLPS